MENSPKSTYSFNVVPEKNWIFQLDKKGDKKGIRLMGRGNVFTDSLFSEYIRNMYGREVSALLQGLIKKYGISETPLVLLEANKGGFKFIKGEVAAMAEKISSLLQILVDSYK